MFSITKDYRTETGHRLHPYEGKCSHFHGHSYLWQVTATADTLDQAGMVADFGMLKAAMVRVLEPLDHCFLFSSMDPLITLLQPDELSKVMTGTDGTPGRYRIMPFSPTAEALARWAGREIQENCSNITISCVRVWETATSNAIWTPE